MFKFIRRLFSPKGETADLADVINLPTTPEVELSLEERVGNLEKLQLEGYKASGMASLGIAVNMNNPTNFVREAANAYWRRNHN